MKILDFINFAGVRVNIANPDEAATWTFKRIQAKIKTTVTPVNAAVIVAASKDPDFKKCLAVFDLSIADGLWTAIAATFLRRSRVPHANTSPFLRALFKKSPADSLSVFLLGARQNVVKRAAENFITYHPKARIVGYADGYFKAEDEKGIVDAINKSKAQVLLLGISSPKKEYFIRDNWKRLKVLLSVGVGGQFDIWGGSIKEAPDPVRKFGFEWLFRVCQEPGRLWKRYSITNFKFILLVIKEVLNNHI
jgi:N-acetylglucosaminyldiphosphoundecaprenol N-acetyl-beta-D-mannosaminyltransferase